MIVDWGLMIDDCRSETEVQSNPKACSKEAIKRQYRKMIFFNQQSTIVNQQPKTTTVGTIYCVCGKGIRFKDYNTNQKPNR